MFHFRKDRKTQTKFNFVYGNTPIDLVSSYKYQGVMFDENLNFNSCVMALADSGGRAHGGLITKLRQLRNICFKTFTRAYDACIASILDKGC